MDVKSTMPTIMIAMRKFLLLSVFTGLLLSVFAQRTYKANSVLASGNWFKVSVTETGIYKMDVSFLSSLGLGNNIPSAQIRLYGNGGSMLPEANSLKRIDDLEENAIWVEDGGDGVLNGSDYVLFYAKGPDNWLKDSVNRRFTHQKNIYSDKAFYFLTVGGSGLRVPMQTTSTPASTTVTSFDERYFHELDTVNFLSSGKEWFGEEFSSFPGRSLTRTFQLPLTDLVSGQVSIVTNVADRKSVV